MFKIRKNVDFKKLKKYGFNYDSLCQEWRKEIEDNRRILINVDERLKVIYETYETMGHFDIIYITKVLNDKKYIEDLIKNNLVEELEDEKWN